MMQICQCIKEHLQRVEALNGKDAMKLVERLNKKIKGKHLKCHKCNCALFPHERHIEKCGSCQITEGML